MGRPPKTDEQKELDRKIGQRFAIIRNRMMRKDGKKVSRQYLAEMLGRTVECIRFWEKGERTIPEDVLEQIAKFTSTDIAYLKCEVDDPHFQENLNKQFSEWNEKILKPVKSEMAFIGLLNSLEIDYSVLSLEQQNELYRYVKEQIIFKYQQLKGE